jgi:hypothetical protein
LPPTPGIYGPFFTGIRLMRCELSCMVPWPVRAILFENTCPSPSQDILQPGTRGMTSPFASHAGLVTNLRQRPLPPPVTRKFSARLQLEVNSPVWSPPNHSQRGIFGLLIDCPTTYSQTGMTLPGIKSRHDSPIGLPQRFMFPANPEQDVYFTWSVYPQVVTGPFNA